jgi:cytochrome o ubiquinol oxidase operon protein cyoD
MQGTRSIFVGFSFAIVLTVIPFLLVDGKWLSRDAVLWVIGGMAIAQIAVHMRFFLGIGFGPKHRERAVSLLFACVLLFFMVGGTIWVIGNLNWRMMH